jgi:hypothetical protein
MTDDRAASVTINYILGLSITFLLVTGLFIAGGDFVSDQRETSVRTELQVLGEQVAADISMADRLARSTSDNETVRVRRELPSSVSGTNYAIEIQGGSDPEVLLTSNDPDIEVTVGFTNETNVEMTSISGGPIAVVLTSSDTLDIERGGS